MSELDPDLLAPYERGEIDDMRLKEGSPIAEGSPILITKITTRHGDGDDNDAVISPDVWTDKIIVINNGEIDAVGNHVELLIRNKIYQEVYESQMKGGNA